MLELIKLNVINYNHIITAVVPIPLLWLDHCLKPNRVLRHVVSLFTELCFWSLPFALRTVLFSKSYSTTLNWILNQIVITYQSESVERFHWGMTQVQI